MTGMHEPEFSRPFRVDRLGSAAIVQALEAGPEERARLAIRLGLTALDRLCATVTLRREAGADLILVAGRLEADVVQTCVVSLEPFASHVEDSFSESFTESPGFAGDSAIAEAIEIDLDEDAPEPIAGGVIDLGELVAQFLSLALDPYPRAPGVALDAEWTGDADSLSPFAVLQRLKPQD
jgi:uncharacterized metal-binding protein YceD (DUF177 family)